MQETRTRLKGNSGDVEDPTFARDSPDLEATASISEDLKKQDTSSQGYRLDAAAANGSRTQRI